MKRVENYSGKSSCQLRVCAITDVIYHMVNSSYRFRTIDETVCQYHERTRDKQIDQRLQKRTKEK